jgi:hypothetical protein
MDGRGAAGGATTRAKASTEEGGSSARGLRWRPSRGRGAIGGGAGDLRVFSLGADESRSTADDAAATCDARRRVRGFHRRTRTCLWPPPASATWHCAHFVLNIFAPVAWERKRDGFGQREASARAEARGGDDARIARSREGAKRRTHPWRRHRRELPRKKPSCASIVRRRMCCVRGGDRASRRKAATVERSARGARPRLWLARRPGASVRPRARTRTGSTHALARPRTTPARRQKTSPAAPAGDRPLARRARRRTLRALALYGTSGRFTDLVARDGAATSDRQHAA